MESVAHLRSSLDVEVDIVAARWSQMSFLLISHGSAIKLTCRQVHPHSSPKRPALTQPRRYRLLHRDCTLTPALRMKRA